MTEKEMLKISVEESRGIPPPAAMALAIATRCCSPPLIMPGIFL